MILALTMMVRDEVDIIAATIEHHLAHGVDRIIVTDNASVDGTRELLARYAEVAPVTVLDDPEHRKQQGEVVTRMARQAYDEFGATWVINGDADEFLVPVDRARTLREIFEAMPIDVGAFTVPVVNLIGSIGASGSGIRRLTTRDERSDEELIAAGLHAHPTPNAIHVGAPDVTVAQGNHFVSIEHGAPVPEGLELEVLHLPWRSVAQVERKTENMGAGYDASPHLNPSPNHHGMRDWRRLQGGVLTPFLALRMPTTKELEVLNVTRDERLARDLDALVQNAVIPDALTASIDDTGDGVLSDAEILDLRARADEISRFEDALRAPYEQERWRADRMTERVEELEHELEQAHLETRASEAETGRVAASLADTERALDEARQHAGELRAQLDRYEQHPIAKAVRSVQHLVRRDGR